jgi:hypothetical protein
MCPESDLSVTPENISDKNFEIMWAPIDIIQNIDKLYRASWLMG